MGKDIHVYIVIKNKEGKWEEKHLYRKRGYKKFARIEPYPYRNYELFDILSGNEDDNFPMTPINITSLPDPLVNRINAAFDTDDCYEFHEVNYADLLLYLKDHPKVRDYDYEAKNDKDFDKNGWKDNPIIAFKNNIVSYLNFANAYWDFEGIPSRIRIIYYFDC